MLKFAIVAAFIAMLFGPAILGVRTMNEQEAKK